jgi:hypothetical protein
LLISPPLARSALRRAPLAEPALHASSRAPPSRELARGGDRSSPVSAGVAQPRRDAIDGEVNALADTLVAIAQAIPAGRSFNAISSFLPLGLRGTAIVSFGLTMAVVVLLTLVSQGGLRTGELSTAVPSFFAFYAFLFGMVYWLFA